MTPHEMIAAINAAYPECQYVSLTADLTDYHIGGGPSVSFRIAIQPGIDGKECSHEPGRTLQAAFDATMLTIRNHCGKPSHDGFTVFVDSVSPTEELVTT